MQLAARQHRLEEVAGVHAALRFARTDYGVQLVDEQYYLSLGLLYLLQHGLEALFKFAPVLCAGDERAHIQREYCLVLKSLGHVAAHDALGKALGDGGLADARLADEHGVVLRLAREYAHDVSYLRVPAYDRVELVVSGALDKVGAVLRQSVIAVLGIVPRDGSLLDLGQLGGEFGLGYAVVGENALYRGCCRGKNAYHDMLD